MQAPNGFRGAIFDVDGVLVDSPHEEAWREGLKELMENEWAGTAAEELGTSPENSFVIEDAVNGVQAAKAGEMAGLGLARANDEAALAEAGADLVVTSLDDVDLDALAEGRLEHAGVR